MGIPTFANGEIPLNIRQHLYWNFASGERSTGENPIGEVPVTQNYYFRT